MGCIMEKGLLFDFNGTMFFDSPKHKIAWDVFSEKYRGKPISDDEMDHMHGQTNAQIIKVLMGEMSDEESEKLSKDKEALYREICLQQPESFHLAPGLTEILDQLKMMQVPMTICTASIKENVDFFVSSFHLDKWFDVNNIIYDDGTHSNKISMFEDGAKRIGVPLSNCMIVEDSLSGIAFAHACHVEKIVAITTADKIEEYKNMPGVDEVIQDYYQFDLSFFQNK